MSWAERIEFGKSTCSFPENVATMLGFELTTMPIDDFANRSWGVFEQQIKLIHDNFDALNESFMDGNLSSVLRAHAQVQPNNERLQLLSDICYMAGCVALASMTPEDFRS